MIVPTDSIAQNTVHCRFVRPIRRSERVCLEGVFVVAIRRAVVRDEADAPFVRHPIPPEPGRDGKPSALESESALCIDRAPRCRIRLPDAYDALMAADGYRSCVDNRMVEYVALPADLVDDVCIALRGRIQLRHPVSSRMNVTVLLTANRLPLPVQLLLLQLMDRTMEPPAGSLQVHIPIMFRFAFAAVRVEQIGKRPVLQGAHRQFAFAHVVDLARGQRGAAVRILDQIIRAIGHESAGALRMLMFNRPFVEFVEDGRHEQLHPLLVRHRLIGDERFVALRRSERIAQSNHLLHRLKYTARSVHFVPIFASPPAPPAFVVIAVALAVDALPIEILVERPYVAACGAPLLPPPDDKIIRVNVLVFPCQVVLPFDLIADGIDDRINAADLLPVFPGDLLFAPAVHEPFDHVPLLPGQAASVDEPIEIGVQTDDLRIERGCPGSLISGCAPIACANVKRSAELEQRFDALRVAERNVAIAALGIAKIGVCTPHINHLWIGCFASLWR